jgi:hypothetical protein
MTTIGTHDYKLYELWHNEDKSDFNEGIFVMHLAAQFMHVNKKTKFCRFSESIEFDITLRYRYDQHHTDFDFVAMTVR